MARGVNTLIALCAGAWFACAILPGVFGQADAKPLPALADWPNAGAEPVGYGRRYYRRYGYRSPYVGAMPPAYGPLFYRRGGYYWFPRVPGYPYYAPYAWPHYPPY